jgi:hypothetical protein
MRKTILLFFAIWAMTQITLATNYYVATTGSDSNNGLSWSTPFATINQAITSATALGGNVWIKTGTYNISGITPAANVHLYGGFIGTEVSLTNRALSDKDGNGIIDPWEFTNETLLNITNTSNVGININSTSMATADKLIIDGFTITYTCTSATVPPAVVSLASNVGAITFQNNIIRNCAITGVVADGNTTAMLINSRGILKNCLFEKNNATITFTGQGATPFVTLINSRATGCVFRNNKNTANYSTINYVSNYNSAYRGMIVHFLAGSSSAPSNTTLATSLFYNNELNCIGYKDVPTNGLNNASVVGYGIYSASYGTDSVINCVFARNKGILTCYQATGIYVIEQPNVHHYMLNNVFWNNTQNTGGNRNFKVDAITSGYVGNNVMNAGNTYTASAYISSTSNLTDLNTSNTDATKGAMFKNPTTTVGNTTDLSTEHSDWRILTTSYLVGTGNATTILTDKAGNLFAPSPASGAYENPDPILPSATYYWPLDNSTVVGGVTMTTSGRDLSFRTDRKLGTNALLFAPSLNYLTQTPMATTNGVNLDSSGKYTVSLWASPGVFQNSYVNGVVSTLVSKIQTAKQFEILLNRDGFVIANVYGAATNMVTVQSPNPVLLNRWSHISLVVDKSNSLVSLYVNGVSVNSIALPFMPASATSAVTFGNSSSSGETTWYDGSLDDVKLFNGVTLSSNQLLKLASEALDPDFNWQFNGNAKDFMGYSDGTAIDAQYAVGVRGSDALQFSSDKGYVASKALSVSENGSFTLSTWVNPTAYPSTAWDIIRKTETANQFQLQLGTAGIHFQLWDETGGVIAVDSKNQIPLNAWTHIVVVVNDDGFDNRIMLYINGVADNTTSFLITRHIKKATDKLTIGNALNATSNSFKGLIDDVRIYKNKVLSTSKITEIFSNIEIPDATAAPYQQAPYWKSEYRTLKYEPNFIPGIVTFDERNRPYIRKATYVQTIDDNGKWIRLDFTQFIKSAFPTWNGLFDTGDPQTYGESLENHVIFDNNNWAYMYIFPRGATDAVLRSHSLLLYSSDHCRTWKTVVLPTNGSARIERLNAFNEMAGPPVVLQLGTAVGDSIPMYALTFQKNGTDLTLKNQILISNKTNAFYEHSGAPQTVITKGNKSFIAYASPVFAPGQVGNACYIVTLDRTTLALSAPVFLGYAGNNTVFDGHNYPSLVIDSKGYLHALLVGHHCPWLMYTTSVNPNNADTWTTPVQVGVNGTVNGHSYVSFVCDINDALHVTTRWTDYYYYFSIGYIMKKPGQNWTSVQRIVIPFESNYCVLQQKLNMDRLGNLYVNFMQNHQVMSNRSYDTYNVEWPEDGLASKVTRPVGTANTTQLMYASGNKQHFPELARLATGSTTWKLTATPDFKSGLLAGALSDKATLPVPQDLSTISTATPLSWTAGARAVSHRVYYSTNPIMSESDFKTEQSGTSYTATLLPNTKYYWRIDEKNANGVTKGFTWSFTTSASYHIKVTELINPDMSGLATFSVSPNPSKSDVIHLMGQLSEPTAMNVDLHNALGQLVKQVEFPAENAGIVNQTINAGVCKSGVYFLKIISKNQVKTIPVIINQE